MNNANLGSSGQGFGHPQYFRQARPAPGQPQFYDVNAEGLSNYSQPHQTPTTSAVGYGAIPYRPSQQQTQDFGRLYGTSEEVARAPVGDTANSQSYSQNSPQTPLHSRSYYPTPPTSKLSPNNPSLNTSSSTHSGPYPPCTDSPGAGGGYTSPRMQQGSSQSYPAGQQGGPTPTLNHLLQSSSPVSGQKTLPSSLPSSLPREDPGIQGKVDHGSPQSSYMSHQSPAMGGWPMNMRSHSMPYGYQQAPNQSMYRSQPGVSSEMSQQGRRPPPMGAMGSPYPQPGAAGQYMGQQMPPMGPGPGPQRFMMAGQMVNPMYPNQPGQMYMPPNQQPPGPPLSPANRPLTPQQSQLQQMQNMVVNSPKQPSPAPSVSSDHGSTHSNKPGDEGSGDVKMEPEDPSGENSRGSSSGAHPRPAPSPAGSTGSRSNTPASIPGGQAGSPMPVRPPSGQVDGTGRMTQSPMASTGYNQQMMPPPNSMGFMPSTGKMGGPGQMPGHYPQYNSQYPPQGNYARQQPGMGGMSGPMSGPMQTYPGSQPGMYPNGPGGQMPPGAPMYNNMGGMSRGMGQPTGYGPGPYPQGPNTSMMNPQYPSYNSPHMGAPPMNSQPGGPMMGQQQQGGSNKAAQAAQAALMAAANSTAGPRMSRGAMSPSRGMFQGGGVGGGPLAQMNNMTNSPNFGSPSLNSMSNAVEQLGRGTMGPTTSPVPKSINPQSMSGPQHNMTGDMCQSSPSMLGVPADAQDSSRPNSAAHPPDLTHTTDTTGSDSSGGMPSDSTSVDSGFHSSDQGDKTSDSVSTPTQSVPSPPPSSSAGLPNGETPRIMDNMSPMGQHQQQQQPPSHPHLHSHQNHQLPQQHPHQQQPSGEAGLDNKMPYSNDAGVPLPASSLSSMSSMPSSTGTVVTTAAAGPVSTSVTQSIASPVTSVTGSMSPHHPQHMVGPHPMMGGHPHGIAPHMMQNGMPPAGMMNTGGHMAGGQMPQNMMAPNMGGPNMNMNQNGPMMGPHGPHPQQMMGHNGPMMQGPPGMNNGGNGSMMPMPGGQMPPHPHMQQQQLPQQGQMNCMPPMAGNNNNAPPPADEPPPEKKKKTKELEGSRSGSTGAHFSEEPSSPGALKSSSDVSKLFELGPEPDRRPFLERVLSFLDESGQAVTSLPVISKTPLDLYKLYFSVREKGGFEEVTRNKKWREICTVVNIGTSASAAFTLKKNYIRYLFNYECKFDRGGINPAPILAQMEAQLASKRESKSKRAPSPGSNSNDSFRPPSTPNSQMDSGFPPSNMPPPYIQNPDGSMAPNQHLSGGNMMMGPNNMMPGAPGPHMGPMMGGPPGMMAGPPGMMGQQGMIPQTSGPGTGMMGGPPQMMPQGPPGYGAPPMMQQQPQQPGGPMPPTSVNSTCGPMINSDSVSVQDPFSDEPYSRGSGSAGPQPTPPPASMVSSCSGMPPQSGMDSSMSSSMNCNTQTSSATGPMPNTSVAGPYPGVEAQPGFPPRTGEAGSPFQPQMDRPDRMGMRPPVPSSQAPGEAPMYPSYPSGPMMRPTGESQYPGYQGQYGGQYQGYPPGSQGGYPRPTGAPMYGTPNKRYPDEPGPAPNQYSDWSSPGLGGHMAYPSPAPERQAPSPDDHMGPQWSPVARPRIAQNSPGYMPPGPPSTPPMGPFSRQLGHRNSPQSRDSGARYASAQKMQKTPYSGMPSQQMSKKELIFSSDCVEGVGIATTKRKKLTHKDLAPFEAWRLMLALKSGQLAESTWALDTMNILLYDDSTYGYFSLNTLPGLLEVLTEHFRHCLINMFEDFQELEEGQSRKAMIRASRLRKCPSASDKSLSAAVEEASKNIKSVEAPEDKSSQDEEEISVFHITGPNYTKVSRKGLPVKYDTAPRDSTVLESKDWDIYTHFDTKPDHWLLGCGDITDHILTHMESEQTNKFLSAKFRRKRRLEEDSIEDTVAGEGKKEVLARSRSKMSKSEQSVGVESTKESHTVKEECVSQESEKDKSSEKEAKPSLENSVGTESGSVAQSASVPASSEATESSSTEQVNHSKLCNGGGDMPDLEEADVHIKLEPKDMPEEPMQLEKQIEKNPVGMTNNTHSQAMNGDSEISVKEEITDKTTKEDKEICAKVGADKDEAQKVEDLNLKNSSNDKTSSDSSKEDKPVENGELEEPKLSPMVNHKDNEEITGSSKEAKDNSHKDLENDCSDSSPPVLKAEGLEGCDEEDGSEPLNSTMEPESDGTNMDVQDTSVVMDTNTVTPAQASDKATNEQDKEVEEKPNVKECPTVVLDSVKKENNSTAADNPSTTAAGHKEGDSFLFNASIVSETEELSASVVADMLKEDENMEDEAFQRDDPPLCVTPESRDELGRRCVCISNIFRSLSCVPGNELVICRHPGIMRVLGHLLLLHHSHPERPAPRKLPSGDEDEIEEEEKEEPPRVYDDEHWWWDYLDQLRENTLVILANVCGHLMLDKFSQEVCFPLLEGLLHWVTCPASVARDPMPTLTSGSMLSPQRLVLEALCKLCIQESNVDLLLATPPVKRLLELYSVLVHLLADRNHPITREFSIVLLSFLVPGDSSAARAVALQHPCVSLLVDFLETAEQSALNIATQQGTDVLRNNPEVMGTSLDMLRRAASILLHMARVPDNRRLFVQQQPRLLNLVMSPILDQTVSNTLSEVLFECSQGLL